MSANTSTLKTFNTRDAATSYLRKQGMDKSHYSEFITNTGRGLTINLAQVDEFLHPTVKAPKVKVVKTPAVKAPNGNGLAGQIRTLILAGQTNEQIFAELSLPEAKKSYPAWYRRQLALK